MIGRARRGADGPIRDGAWALVTGASSGIGRAFAEHLAACGLNLILVSEDRAALDRVVGELAARAVEVRPLCFDLREPDAGVRILDEVGSLPVGVLVNCVGYGMMGYIIQHAIADHLAMLRVNDEAALIFSHHFARLWYTQGRRGAIITVSSANAEFNEGIPFSAVYSAGKSFLKHFTQALYYEMKPFGIDVINVSAGPTATGFQERAHTNRLHFVETPANVVAKTFARLGRRSTVTTNGLARLLILVARSLPFENLRFYVRTRFFRRVLAKPGTITLAGLVADSEAPFSGRKVR